MGDPFLKLNNLTVKVDGFFFNIGMTVFREEWKKRRSDLSPGSVIAKMAAHIETLGYEHISDTVFYFDAFVAVEKDRADVIQWLEELIKTVLQPGYRLPEAWQKLLRGEIGGTPPIPITREHFLGIAYIYQTMVDLIEGKIEGRIVLRNRRPVDWEPSEHA